MNLDKFLKKEFINISDLDYVSDGILLRHYGIG